MNEASIPLSCCMLLPSGDRPIWQAVRRSTSRYYHRLQGGQTSRSSTVLHRDGAHHVLVSVAGSGDLDDALVDVVVLQPERPTHRGVQQVAGHRVGELEDRHLAQRRREGGEGGVL